jgi:hypothetical protein
VTTSTFTGNGTVGVAGTLYQVLTFRDDTSFAVPAGVSLELDFLVIGGGGSGAAAGGSGAGGGGGAGEMVEGRVVLATGSYTVDVGAGGGAPSAAVAPSGPTSATLCVGPRGLCPGASPSDYQLPPGWSVTGIDLRRGLLSLRQGGLPLRLPLGAGRGAAPGQAVGSANPGPVNPASANPASAANSPVAAAPTAAGQAAGPAQTPSGR